MIIYDPDGRDITMAEYVRRYPDEGVIADQTLPSGHHVATLWVGVDDRLEPVGPPLIYETLVTGPHPGDRWHGHTDRYATLIEALTGHLRLAATLMSTPDRTEPDDSTHTGPVTG